MRHISFWLRICLVLSIISFFFMVYKSVSIGTSDGSAFINPYTRCLLSVHNALDSLSIPWFITFGTALTYWRSRNFISNDLDIGIFYTDLVARAISDKQLVSKMKRNYRFYFRHSYGQLDHGQEWSFLCPKSKIPLDIFVFYPLVESNTSSAYWSATYNGLCDKMAYKKCRWRFKQFNLTTFKLFQKEFSVVPIEFIRERYGPNYMVPKKYSYFESLKILPNLIEE